MTDVDGIYAVYITGSFGSNVGVIVMNNGELYGADLGGGIYDGYYTPIKKGIEVDLKLKIKEGNITVTGIPITQDSHIPMHIILPYDFYERDYVSLDTEIGELNARFVLLRKLGGK